MVFCAYCGKCFTRKEHLERHIPSHTNVKPHRCSACQLSFARRDLLQRHHSTYHEARDPMEPLPGGVPTVAGRTPIACQNCANAKTGCDKRVPCSRCAEKNLPCAARFARRSSKAAARAAQANAAAVAFNTQMVTSPQQQTPPSLTPAFLDLNQHTTVKTGSPIQSPLSLDQIMVGSAASLDMCLPDGSSLHPSPLQHQLHSHSLSHQGHHPNLFSQHKKSPTHAHGLVGSDDFSPHGGRIEGLADFMGFGTAAGDFIGSDPNYPELIWTDYPVDLDMYANPLQLAQTGDTAVSPLMPSFTASTEVSDISSSSEAMTVSSSHNSIHTRDTSIFSISDNDGLTGGPLSAGNSDPASVQDSKRSSLPQSCTLVDRTAMVPAADGAIPEFEVVVASEAAWPLARCNPPIYSGSCPRTAIVHLECLEQKSKQESTWHALEQYLETLPDSPDAPQVVPLTSRSRENMLAIMQSFLHKALDVHRSGLYPKSGASGASSPAADINFLVLPPSRILEYFLRSYVHSLSIYYPLVMGGIVDPNEMLDNSQASTLLVLLMIAQGAASVPMAEARYLSAGLSETCRISLFDIIEKNVELSADPLALRCALLFTLLGAWGGDKWHMDIAMGQRSMYISMLKHAGMLEAQPPMAPSLGGQGIELQWRSWLQREGQNRLVYNWVMVDQELSLFHDTAPVLSVNELLCPLPSSDVLWLAPTAEHWLAAAQGATGSLSGTPSLCDVFQDFLQDNLVQHKGMLTPQLLRLLLHPLQTLLYHLSTMLACMPDVAPGRRASGGRTITKASTVQRLEEVQAQLQQWYELSVVYGKAHPACAVTRCNLVLYHLISLNAISSFPQVERLARRDGLGEGRAQGGWSGLSGLGSRHRQCILQREEVLFHCGQVLRLLRQMDADRRPSWWSTALYRAILLLWADSVCRLDPNFSQQESSQGKRSSVGVAGVATAVSSSSSTPTASSTTTASSPAQSSGSPGQSSRRGSSPGNTSLSTLVVAIDQVRPEDAEAIGCLWQEESMAVLTRNDGSHFALEQPASILNYGIQRINEAMSTRIGDGIRRKLLTLAGNWASETLM